MRGERALRLLKGIGNLLQGGGGRPAPTLPPAPDSVPLVHYLEQGDTAGVSPHPLFEPGWYRAQSPNITQGESALSHYVRVGDAAGLSPHPLFDPRWYRTQTQPLLLAQFDTTLAHYLRQGEGAGRQPHPLFDVAWYRSRAPALRAADNALLHYVREGDALGLSPHPLFDPGWYRAQGPKLIANESALAHYVREGDALGLSPHPLFDSGYYRWRHPELARQNALVHFLASGFDVAEYVAYVRQHPELEKLADHPLIRRLQQREQLELQASAPTLPRRMSADNRLLRSVSGHAQKRQSSAPAAPRSAKQASAARIVVYTCCYGNYESLKEPAVSDPSVRFIAYTDDPNLRSEGWEVCLLNDHLSNSRRSSRLPKILPHLYLPDHDVSVYIDASLQWRARDANAMVEECLGGQDFGLYRHSRRDCVYDEIDICDNLDIERKDVVAFYRSHYQSLDFPRHAGLYEHGLIVRRNTAATRALNEAWWRMYRGERDQLSLMSAVHSTGIGVNAIKHGKQVRTNPYVSFFQHERKRLPEKSPKLYVFIAYAPPDYQQDLGRAYNDYMNLIEDDAYALFLDHDAMFCNPDWFRLVHQMMTGYSGVECLIVGRTNRIGNPYQRAGALAEEHHVSAHTELAACLAETQGDWVANVSSLDSTSGVVLMLSKATWKQVPFTRGFLKVDNRMHIAFRESGRPVFMPLSLYVYHFYRADGDASHAVRIDPSLDASPSNGAATADERAKHRLKNFVYQEAAGLDFAHYAGLLQSDEWAVFLRWDTMFCDKSWYTRAYGRLDHLPPNALVAFGNSLVDESAPRTDDIRDHRDYAARRLGAEGLRHRATDRVSAEDLVAFMVSKATLEDLVAEGGRSVADLVKLVERQPRPVFEDDSTHVFCQESAERAVPATLPAASGSELRKIFTGSRRVAILTLGFWPSQAGMELMIHNLAEHLTQAGDLVTLYAPKPEKAFEEIPHTYLLKRFKNEQHFLEMFRIQHAVLPVDVILVQGALEAASMALKLKEEFGVAVVLRTHGEDIQVDDETGYGYRRDPEKRAIIDSNIQRVDRNVVIGEHIGPLVTGIAPSAVVKTIHNGVDVKRFRPQQTRYLRDKLGLDDDKLVLLTVGRNVKKKALHLAVHALKSVLERVPQAVLVHVGKNGNGENLLETAQKLGVERSFFALGEVDYFETPLVYASADLFVFPSKVETFGNVTVEALSSGLPCVEFDYSVNRQKITSGQNGYIVPFGEVEQLADRIVELLLDPDKRRAFSEAARRAAEEVFAWPRVAEEYRSVFREFRNVGSTRRSPVTGYGTAPILHTVEAT